MKLTQIISWQLPRDEDDRTEDLWLRHRIERVMSWWPEPWDRGETPYERHELKLRHEKGARAIRALGNGSEVKDDNLRLGIEYLTACAEWYEAEPWGGVEPYEGRNEIAAGEFREVLGMILEALPAPVEAS